MFTPPDKQPEIVLDDREAKVLTEEPVEPAVEEELPEIQSNDIHTMPDKFLKSTDAPKTKGRISWVVLASVIFIVVGGVIVTLFLYFTREDEVLTIPDDISNLNINIDLPTSTPSDLDDVNDDTDLTEPESRDSKRLNDIYDLKSALAMYFAKYDEYPVNLNTLLRDYLTLIPENPTPGGDSYDYKVNQDQIDFELTFSLESGGPFGNLTLDASKYVLTPQGIRLYIDPDSLLPDDEVIADTTQIQMGLDSDEDGVSDIEENMYQTNSTLKDSDEDGYDDAIEILALFDPAIGDGAKLLDSSSVAIYQNPSYFYSLIYPASWTTTPLTVDNKEVVFISSTGEFFEVIIQDNPLGMSAYSWYLANNPGVDPNTLTTLLIDGLPAVKSPDGLRTYLGIGSSIYMLNYNVGASMQTNFYTSYRLFSEKLIFIDPSTIEVGDTGTTTTQE
ncbi:hypothetical protein HOE31_00170 [bacterium]|mgnify:FL=1|jgi:hypothetical protein|nr:hypothetical protein [bacterium]MBT4121356.1 hypothetical protein [bacterium]MBT4495235.1 hypothetical protein [bacterium]MBT4763844.1 hypothetical protein [bacterium]MBT5401214.1 hypothetical protein [bacterium]